MSIFTRIRDAIFGHKPASNTRPTTPQQTRPADTATRTATTASAIPASPADAKWERQVDVEEVLRDLAAKNPEKLNWETSIVDLMKLLGIDSSREHRQELARELGYTGDMKDSASMNIWLHKRVMQELERNGGKVPAALVA